MGGAVTRLDFAKFFLKSLDQGVATHVRAAFEPTLKGMKLKTKSILIDTAYKMAEHNGQYLEESELAPDNAVKDWAKDKAQAERLWKESEKIVGQTFTY